MPSVSCDGTLQRFNTKHIRLQATTFTRSSHPFHPRCRLSRPTGTLRLHQRRRARTHAKRSCKGLRRKRTCGSLSLCNDLAGLIDRPLHSMLTVLYAVAVCTTHHLVKCLTIRRGNKETQSTAQRLFFVHERCTMSSCF